MPSSTILLLERCQGTKKLVAVTCRAQAQERAGLMDGMWARAGSTGRGAGTGRTSETRGHSRVEGRVGLRFQEMEARAGFQLPQASGPCAETFS